MAWAGAWLHGWGTDSWAASESTPRVMMIEGQKVVLVPNQLALPKFKPICLP